MMMLKVSKVVRECGHAEAGGSAAQNGPQQERAGDTAMPPWVVVALLAAAGALSGLA
jgi:hypothetical protein